MERPPPAQDGARVRRDLTAALAGLAALLAVLLVAATMISHTLQASAERAFARDALPIKSRVDDLLVQMLDQETGVRGFIASGRPSSLAPFHAGRAGAARDLAVLQARTGMHPVLRRLLGTARVQVADLEDFFDRQVAMARAGPAGRAVAQTHVERGKALFDAFRVTAERMRAATDAFVAETVTRQRHRYHTLLVILGVIGAAALAVAAALIAIVPRRAARLVSERARRLEEERETAELLQRVLAASPALFEGADPEDVPRRVCAGAVEVFECAAASLWRVEDDALVLADRVPWSEAYSGGDRRPIEELPGLRDALAATRPLFVPDLRIASTGATRGTAERVASGSLLNLPIAIAGVSELVLGLTWSELVPAPSEARRLAAQRFADQAGLALEQARRRSAQDEVEALNRTLSRMVQTDPLFRADGTPEEVGQAICAAAVRVFHSEAAALWVHDREGGLTLLHRLPATPALPPGIRLDRAAHPAIVADLEPGRPHFLADLEEDEPALWSEFASRSGSRSQLRLPLASAGGAGAMIVLSWRERQEPPTDPERALAARFADQAAVALAEAQRRETARAGEALHAQLERSLLPTITVSDPRLRVASLYRAGDERLSLGGDFHDCLQRDDGTLAVLIGDVAGHGPAAAALGASLRGAWRGLVLAGAPIDELLPTLERVVEREREDRGTFVTALTAALDVGGAELRVACAGHPPPVVVGPPPRGRLTPGPPLGVAPERGAPVARLELAPPASLVLYTDGLVEGRAAPDSTERFGVERLEALLAEIRPGGVRERELQGVVAAATRAHGEGLPDDVAVLAINLAGGAAPAAAADGPAASSVSVRLGAPASG